MAQQLQGLVRDAGTNHMIARTRILVLYTTLTTPAFALASNFQHSSQFYSDSQNTSGQSHGLQYSNEFYFVEDPAYQTTLSLQYQRDSWQGIPSATPTTQDALSDLTTDGFDLRLSQGVLPDTSILLNGGYSFGSSYQTISYGGGINPRFFRNNTSLLIGVNRVTGNKPSETFLARDLSEVPTSSTQNGTAYYTFLTQNFSKLTIGRIGWRYNQRTELSNAEVLSVRIHQWLPTRSAVQVEYSYFLNVGNIPVTSTLGRLRAHAIDTSFHQYITPKTVAALRYRFYKETEEVESNFQNILGSDLLGLSFSQDLAPWLNTFDTAKLALNTDRYVNNRNRQGWIVSLLTNITKIPM